jgi:hypothetical protein
VRLAADLDLQRVAVLDEVGLLVVAEADAQLAVAEAQRERK